MTRFGKKLSLNRETVRDLTPEEMARVGGGGGDPHYKKRTGGGNDGPGAATLYSCQTIIEWGGTCNPCNTCFTQGG